MALRSGTVGPLVWRAARPGVPPAVRWRRPQPHGLQSVPHSTSPPPPQQGYVACVTPFAKGAPGGPGHKPAGWTGGKADDGPVLSLGGILEPSPRAPHQPSSTSPPPTPSAGPGSPIAECLSPQGTGGLPPFLVRSCTASWVASLEGPGSPNRLLYLSCSHGWVGVPSPARLHQPPPHHLQIATAALASFSPPHLSGPSLCTPGPASSGTQNRSCSACHHQARQARRAPLPVSGLCTVAARSGFCCRLAAFPSRGWEAPDPLASWILVGVTKALARPTWCPPF
ncbi:hypothetical protein NDU88_011802 [Pleurodeles waltl]|uniref:Uncharacterized protein n=1 Tax=Pleurodeles waltl TaxID=8319 RepID=A0AAV7QYT1_PLEWA|nr:hypothetical protein NDU88_011802 [Pleurodeles waltl]